MDPITIAVLIATKAFEKTGEKIGEETWKLVEKFLTVLKSNAPTTANKIKKVAEKPALAESQPELYARETLIQEVKNAADEEPEIKIAAQDIAQKIRSQSNVINSLNQSVDKIGISIPVQNSDNATIHIDSPQMNF